MLFWSERIIPTKRSDDSYCIRWSDVFVSISFFSLAAWNLIRIENLDWGSALGMSAQTVLTWWQLYAFTFPIRGARPGHVWLLGWSRAILCARNVNYSWTWCRTHGVISRFWADQCGGWSRWSLRIHCTFEAPVWKSVDRKWRHTYAAWNMLGHVAVKDQLRLDFRWTPHADFQSPPANSKWIISLSRIANKI